MGIEIIAAGVAVFAAVWAGFMVLAEEAPGIAPSLTDSTAETSALLPLHREFQISRLALLVISSSAAGTAVGWWSRQPVSSVVTALVTLSFLLLVGETLPRIAGNLLPNAAVAVAPLARRTIVLFTLLFGWIAMNERLLRRLFPGVGSRKPEMSPVQRDMMVGVFALNETTVEEIMTPRLDIVAVEGEATWPEVVDVLRRSEHGRLPVYRGNPDGIVGIIYAKDLVPAVAGAQPVPERWQDFIRPAQFVPEAKPVDAQLRAFQSNRGNMAIVVDEFGGTSGLVTLEDVLEEIVGEIHDEYDVDEKPAIESEGKDKYWIDGGVSLDELSAAVGIAVDKEDISTLGGLIYSELGRVPKPGEELVLGDFRVVVEQVVRRRVRRVYFERLDRTVAEEEV